MVSRLFPKADHSCTPSSIYIRLHCSIYLKVDSLSSLQITNIYPPTVDRIKPGDNQPLSGSLSSTYWEVCLPTKPSGFALYYIWSSHTNKQTNKQTGLCLCSLARSSLQFGFQWPRQETSPLLTAGCLSRRAVGPGLSFGAA